MTHLSSRSSLTLLRADLMDSRAEDTGNSLLAFPLSTHGCLIPPSPASLLMHVFMNDRTRLLVTNLSPSDCFTTAATVDNEAVSCQMISQSSKDMLNLLSSPSVICTLTQYICTLSWTVIKESPVLCVVQDSYIVSRIIYLLGHRTPRQTPCLPSGMGTASHGRYTCTQFVSRHHLLYSNLIPHIPCP